MNQLDFSPISERDEQSIDTLSFLHSTLQHQRNRHAQHALQGSKRIFDKLSRVVHNRQSYGFQLLKQFILFSSDQQTIQIHYKYTQYQLEKGTEHLENSYGIKVKLTLGKAFEDIRSFYRKKKTYKNPEYIQNLISVYDKVMNLNRQQSYRAVIKILAKFIQKKLILPKKSQIQQQTTELIKCLQKQIQTQQIQDQKAQQFQEHKPETILKRSSDQLKIMHKSSKNYETMQPRQRRLRKQDLIKTAKFTSVSNLSNDKPSQIEHSKWKQQVQDIDSYEQQQSQDDHKFIIKSMSNQLGTSSFKINEPLQLTKLTKASSNKKNRQKENKCLSTRITPCRNSQQYDVFRTRKKYEEPSLSKNSIQQNQREKNGNKIQNIVIIRSSREHKRSPDRYIRVPITSQQIKIIQLVPEEGKRRKKEKQKKYRVEQKYQTISSKNSSIHKKSEKQQKRFQARKTNQDIQELLMLGKNQRGRQKANAFIHNQGHYMQQSCHQCVGCKYCTLIRQMQNYRKQRTNSKPLNFV